MGKPASTISRVLNGDREPSLSLLRDISEATNGEVTPNDFMESGEISPLSPITSSGAANTLDADASGPASTLQGAGPEADTRGAA